MELLIKTQLNNFREASGHEEFNERYKKLQNKNKNKNLQSLIDDMLIESNKELPSQQIEINENKECFHTDVDANQIERNIHQRFSGMDVWNSIQASTDLRVSVDPDLGISRRTNNFMIHDENASNQFAFQSLNYSPISKFITYSKNSIQKEEVKWSKKDIDHSFLHTGQESHNQDTEFQSKTIDMMPTQMDILTGHLKNRVIIRPNHGRIVVSNKLINSNRMAAWEMERINEEDIEENQNWLNNSMNSIVRLNDNLYDEEIKRSASFVIPDKRVKNFSVDKWRTMK